MDFTAPPHSPMNPLNPLNPFTHDLLTETPSAEVIQPPGAANAQTLADSSGEVVGGILFGTIAVVAFVLLMINLLKDD